MAQEIERKFLVRSTRYRLLGTPTYYKQGYIPTVTGVTVRIRIAGDQGYVTLKDRTVGFSRHEFEYPIAKPDAEQMLDLLCEKPQIEKYRYVVPAADGSRPRPDGTLEVVTGLHWEVDEFLGDNEGLVIAELEVPSEDTEFTLPEWIDREITGEKKYYNRNLTHHPFKSWDKSDSGTETMCPA